jgi:hypothetical protein
VDVSRENFPPTATVQEQKQRGGAALSRFLDRGFVFRAALTCQFAILAPLQQGFDDNRVRESGFSHLGSVIVWRLCGKELQQTGRENRLPDNRTLAHKDGCKSRFYKQLRLASFHAR